MKTQLFMFYGTLRKGYWNQRVLPNSAKFLGQAETVIPFGLFVAKGSSVPTAAPNYGNVSLKGDLYEVPENETGYIYMLESGYRNAEFEVIKESDGEILKAIIFYNEAPSESSYLRVRGYDIVENGDYTTFIGTDGERKR